LEPRLSLLPTAPSWAGAFAPISMSLSDMLTEGGLSHLTDGLASESLDTLATSLAELGRPKFISHLKSLGVEKLSERQKLATMVGKVAKSGGDTSVALKSAGTPIWMPKGSSALYNLTLAREQQLPESPSSQLFAKRIMELPPLGPSVLLPGEVDDATVPLRKPDTGRMRLIALYGSGYDATAFDMWRRQAPKWLEIRAHELPGHGTRESEGVWGLGWPNFEDDALSDAELMPKLARERDAFISTLADELLPLCTPPYAIYGFSSGAFFGYLLVLELQRRKA
jgi:hypothetical protein